MPQQGFAGLFGVEFVFLQVARGLYICTHTQPKSPAWSEFLELTMIQENEEEAQKS